jgi:1-phosphatidylinositol-3-phosphate 5-kinase
MPQKQGIDTSSPSASSIALPLSSSRRGSKASIAPIDKETLSQALDQIHTTASKSDALTTFDEFSAPPRPTSAGESKGLTGELVQGGLTGLYSRLKASVGAGPAKDAVPPPSAGGSHDSADDASIRSLRLKPGQSTSKSSTTVLSSPVAASASSTRLQSPVVSSFPEASQQPSDSIPNSAKSKFSSSSARVETQPPLVLSQSANSQSTGTKPISPERESMPKSLPEIRRKDQNPPFRPASGSAAPAEPTNHVEGTGIADTSGRQNHLRNLSGDSRSGSGDTFRQRPPRNVPSERVGDEDLEVPRRQKPSIPPILPPQERPERTRPADPVRSALLVSQRPPLIQVSQSHLPGFHVSRANSSDGEFSSIVSSITPAPSHNYNFGPGDEYHGRHAPNTQMHDTASRMRSKILAKELWMRDENAKDCFYCGDTFSAFRRKHHCRTCGNIFDSKCTVLAPGNIFGQSGKVRICKPCEAIIYGTDDDSSVISEDADHASSAGHGISPRDTAELDNIFSASDSASQMGDVGTPTIGVPMSRKQGSTTKRRSAVIEVDGHQHTLPRPSSSRSLKSLSGRPRSSSHRRHHSRHGHQHMKSLKSPDQYAPFQRRDPEMSAKGSGLPAFHHDNIIDPDLAPFMSDEGSSDEETPSIFAALNAENHSPGKSGSERSGFGSLLASMRRGAKGTSALSYTSRDAENVSTFGRNQSRHNRKRTLSVSTLHHPSPRRSKSNGLLKGLSIGFGNTPTGTPITSKALPFQAGGNSKMIRSAAMRGPAAPAVELNQASLQHVRRLLRQMLQDLDIPNVRRWEKALLPILLQCTDDVNPDIQRNDDIDIRHYIKLKKIPGGKPGDTSYLSGVVFTKNLALKCMPRSIPNPRIVIVTFPVEYARYQTHFMSLGPVIAQEREYLRNLVKRILALNPHVLLVEKNVAGLALDLLAEANVAVAYNVKPSVLSAVSRCTQTRLITSVDKLNLDPSHVGKCASFDVKTYVHGTVKKTYISITGCQKDLGCTVVLRGAEAEDLRRLKRISEFMCYVVYNLKLETCVMRDEYVHIPAKMDEETQAKGRRRQTSSARGSLDRVGGSSHTGQPEQSLTPAKLGEGVAGGGLSHQETMTGSVEFDDHQPSGTPTFAEDIVERHRTRIVSSSPFVKFMQPYLLSKVREQEGKLANLKCLRDQYSPDQAYESDESDGKEFELVKPEMVHSVVKKPSRQVRDFLYAVHNAEYDKAMHNYQTLKRQWEASCGNTRLFDPFNHQRIAVLYSMVNMKTSNPCVGPDVIALSFYTEHDLDEDFLPDIALGQYVEDLCLGANTPCSALGCGEPLLNHHRQYVHGDGQMTVLVNKSPARIRGMHNTILMWSCCRKCNQETQVIPMSENTWKYSFGKYLELTFWSTELHPRAHACPHDIHKDHFRFFGFNNILIRIQYDVVTLHEIIVPKPSVNWKVDSDLKLKNQQYEKFKDRLDRFMISVKARIESIHVESVSPEKVEACRLEVEKLMKKANEDHKALTQHLQEKYMKSRYYEIIPLNRAGRSIHENSIAWDELFFEFEQDFFPSEKDIRRLAAIQLKKMFIDRDESQVSLDSIEEGKEAAVDIKDIASENITGSPEVTRRLSMMSPEDTQTVLDSIVKEQQASENEKLSIEDLPPSAISTGTPTPDANAQPPIETPLEALDREDVKHLDLAVPADFPDAHPARSEGAGSSTKSADSQETAERATSPVADAQRLQLSPQVSHTVEKMRTTAERGGTDLDSDTIETPLPESRIPRPIETSLRRDGKIVSPKLIRTQSQPQAPTPGSSRRDRGTGDATPMSTSSTLQALSKTGKFKEFIVDPARALERRMADRLAAGPLRSSRTISHSFIPRSVPQNRNQSRVLNLARHFEQISREFEKQRLRERQLRAAKGRRAFPLASSKPIVEVYADEHDAVAERDSADEGHRSMTPTTGRRSTDIETWGESSTTEPTANDAESQPFADEEPVEPPAESQQDESEQPTDTTTTPSGETEGETEMSDTDQTLLDDLEIPESGTETQPLSPTDSQLDLSVELPKHEKLSIMKLLTSFWSERSASGWVPLEYPFSSQEHVWQDSDIIVREDEPASIIALALSSSDYIKKLKTFRNQNPDGTMAEDDMASIERNLLHPKNTNIRYAFQNRGVKAQCKIFFAESFDALRRKTGVADRFVESMSRCLKWDSKGGKTKSLFLKTLDDRFVLKSLSPVEVNAFFKLAPDYFFFIHQNLFTQLPSVIAKMFGLFQVTIRNPASGMEFNWYMIVMENLFYDRHTNRRFDLKGSMRNRKIQSTGEKDEVLLDENLVDLIFEKPIFVREHTMKTLKNSVYNDTLFLSKQNVMDYSLMAGFDDEAREIVVGIIDCIRTYTWDKKLETWIKDRGKNKPTVTSPKDYRNRFRIAMSKYILQAPDCWHQFQAVVAAAQQARQVRVLPRPALREDEGMMGAAGLEEVDWEV